MTDYRINHSKAAFVPYNSATDIDARRPAVDASLLIWIQEHLRFDALTPVVAFISMLGDSGLIWVVLALLFLFFAQLRRAGLMALVSLAGSVLVVNVVLKHLVGRPRPYEVLPEIVRLIPPPSGSSFPSGHAASAFAAAVIMYLYLPKKFGIPALLLATAIALSRLYLGVHYPSDVLAGAVIGSAIAGAVYVVDKKFIEPRMKTKEV